MTDTVPFVDRRRLFALLTGLPVLVRSGTARAALSANAATSFPDAATILIAGPEGGYLDHWSRVVQPALALTLPPSTTLRRVSVGAIDGVTGANQFDARTPPDGQTVLLAPGEAALAWLVGDPRAQYDVARWMSVMAAVAPGVVMARPGAIRPDRRVRLGSSGPAGPDLPAVLAFELLGVQTELLPALSEGAEPAALAGGLVDAVFLRGRNVADRAALLIAAGGRPAFTLGALDDEGRMGRCASFPDVPVLAEFCLTLRGQSPTGPLYAAWCAAAVASQLHFALVLPALTPASMVALWRRASSEAAATLDVQSAALSMGVRAVGGPEAMAIAGAAIADQAALSALRSWLTERFGWSPG